MTELDKRHRSSIYDSMVKSPNRAMLRATGMTTVRIAMSSLF